jgi:hypothetical protein
VSIASGKNVTNIYVGFGASRAAAPKPYEVQLPGLVLKEWAPPEDDQEKSLNEQADVVVEPVMPSEGEE